MQPALRAIFSEVIHRLSNSPMEIRQLTRDLLQNKPKLLLIIGGDGTLSQAVNGLIEQDQWFSPQTKVAYFNCGSGGDFARQFPLQKITEFLDRLVHHQFITTNVGKISFADNTINYFINIASCGASGTIPFHSSRFIWLKRISGKLYYFVHGLFALMAAKQIPVQIQCDDHPPFKVSMLMVALCNGQYFGGRMNVAPLAKFNDNLMDVAIFHDLGRIKALLKFFKIYTGKHLHEKEVHYSQAKSVSIESSSPSVPVEADGEFLGYLPARFELLPISLNLIL